MNLLSIILLQSTMKSHNPGCVLSLSPTPGIVSSLLPSEKGRINLLEVTPFVCLEEPSWVSNLVGSSHETHKRLTNPTRSLSVCLDELTVQTSYLFAWTLHVFVSFCSRSQFPVNTDLSNTHGLELSRDQNQNRSHLQGWATSPSLSPGKAAKISDQDPQFLRIELVTFPRAICDFSENTNAKLDSIRRASCCGINVPIIVHQSGKVKSKTR